MNPPLLVTGGNGMLGRALRRIVPDATFITRQDCDLTDACQVQRVFENIRPRRVVHTASMVGGVKRNAASNADFALINSQINANVLSSAAQIGVERLVAFMSSCAYGMWEQGVVSEDHIHQGMPYDGNLGYGFSKRMLDIQLRLVTQQYGVKCSSLSPVTMYGPHDNLDLEDAHVVAALIHKCFFAQERGQPLEVWGSGEAVRQFVFVDDIARLTLESLEKWDGPDTVIAAADPGATIKELVTEVAAAMEFRGPIHFDATKPEGQKIKRLESRRFSRQFPGFRFIPLREGLRQTVTWFLKEYHPAGAAK